MQSDRERIQGRLDELEIDFTLLSRASISPDDRAIRRATLMREYVALLKALQQLRPQTEKGKNRQQPSR